MNKLSRLDLPEEFTDHLHHMSICRQCALSVRTEGQTKACRTGQQLALRYLRYRASLPGPTGRRAQLFLRMCGEA